MVDLFALVLTHGLLALAAWRLIQRADLDRDPPKAEPVPEEQAQSRRGMRLK
ncbi:hypothetical protein KRR38_18550 [Novosphingobium sp. G106]|uniref:hypothetical protein n=1 Tax=Novosphingobium sp. G106 TaxID=2849500 RepID=UPI001C2DA659|nr:hypothetical protein [Novosphingobium sp. G106]MBV1689628.1 hypothetical protein [Novosphingobium sp. G106]